MSRIRGEPNILFVRDKSVVRYEVGVFTYHISNSPGDSSSIWTHGLSMELIFSTIRSNMCATPIVLLYRIVSLITLSV